jgi:hypothetical protein
MKVEILFIDGCPNRVETASRVNSVADALGLQVEIVEIKVQSGSVPRGFCGSPTVLIDGVDIEPGAGQCDFLCCRIYYAANGISGVPSLEIIRRAFQRSRPSHR